MCQTGFQYALITPCLQKRGYSVKVMKYITVVPVLLMAEVIFTTLYFLFNGMFYMAVKPIIQQASAMFFKAFKYSVKFKKYGTTCLRPLIVFSVTYVGYIFFNNPDTSFVAIAACAIFTLYLELLFITGETNYSAGPSNVLQSYQVFCQI